MNALISPCQSAFIKGRSIHDNFLSVRNIAKKFQQRKKASLAYEVGHHKKLLIQYYVGTILSPYSNTKASHHVGENGF